MGDCPLKPTLAVGTPGRLQPQGCLEADSPSAIARGAGNFSMNNASHVALSRTTVFTRQITSTAASDMSYSASQRYLSTRGGSYDVSATTSKADRMHWGLH